MKKLNESHREIQKTPRQILIEELIKELGGNPDEYNRILSKYEITYTNLASIKTDVPYDLIRKSVKVTLADHWEFTGKVIEILFRDTVYEESEFRNLMELGDMSEEQRKLMEMSLQEEVEPKIYHRIVLNSNEKGIIIIPYLKEVIIEIE